MGLTDGDSPTIGGVTRTTTISAVLWDFGGVILSSPFEAFNRFEAAQGVPLDTIRTINATNPDDNAWAHFERSDISAAEFDQAFAKDAAAAGFNIRGYDVLALLRVFKAREFFWKAIWSLAVSCCVDGAGASQNLDSLVGRP